MVCHQVAEPIHQGRLHGIERGKDAGMNVLLAQVIPDVRHGIEFRTMGRLWEQTDVLGNDAGLGAVPTGAIHVHDDAGIDELVCDMFQQ